MRKTHQPDLALKRTFTAWQGDHRRIDQLADRLLEWFCDTHEDEMTSAAAAKKVRYLCDQVRDHFSKEVELTEMLVEAKGRCTREIESTKQLLARDHRHLLARFKEVILKLKRSVPGSDQWKETVTELGLIVDAFDQHDEEEQGNISSLMLHCRD